MTRKQIIGGILASAVFWGFLSLVIVTNGWGMVAAFLLLAVFGVFAVGVGVAGR